MTRPLPFAALAHLLGALIIATSAVYVHVAMPFVNSPPTAVADSYTVHGNAVLGLLLNDSDPMVILSSSTMLLRRLLMAL